MKRLWLFALLLVPIAVAFVFEPVRIWSRRVLFDAGDVHYMRWVTWFPRNQDKDGSWNPSGAVLEGHAIGRPGATGLALLPLMGAGYVHLSRDEYEGYNIGKSMKAGLQWLIKDQRPDGTFSSSIGAMDHVLATLTLNEAYGMTASQILKGPSQLALDALVLYQDSPEFDDLALQGWTMQALKSAELNELSFPKSAYERSWNFFEERRGDPPGAHEMVSRMFADPSKRDPRIAEGADLLLGYPPEWGQQDFESWYWGSHALVMFDGTSGPKWKAWAPSLNKTILSNMGYKGDWRGNHHGETLVRTSLAAQSYSLFYRYPNGYGTK